MSQDRHRRLRASLVICLAVACFVGTMGSPAPAAPMPGRTEIVSQTAAFPSISADGRVVAFIKEDPEAGLYEIFALDRATGAIDRASDGLDGARPDASTSSEPKVSLDGRFVAFTSRATNLVEGDTNGLTDAFLFDRETGHTERISVQADGTQIDDWASYRTPAVSGDGRYVAFSSQGQLVEEDDNEFEDIYVRDREQGTLELIPSRGFDGSPLNGVSQAADFSADGRYVSFMSEATNLVPGDTSPKPDIFVYDRESGSTELISVSTGGEIANERSYAHRISADGRYVAFESYASNLVPGDTAQCLWPDYKINCVDVFVHDRVTHRTERVSVSSQGIQGDESSSVGGISADGRFVTFSSQASSLSPERPIAHPQMDVYVHDRMSGTTDRVSLGRVTEDADSSSSAPAISADGRFVTFSSGAKNLVPEAQVSDSGLYVRDRGPDLGIEELDVLPQGGAFLVRGWARLGPRVLVEAGDSSFDAPPAGSKAGAELTGARIVLRPELGDMFLHLDTAGIPSVHARPLTDKAQCQYHPYAMCPDTVPAMSIAPGLVWGFTFRLDGVEYQVRAARSERDSLGLFRCSPACAQIAELDGSVGVTGDAIVASVPIDALGVSGEAHLNAVRAFSALGGLEAGTLADLDVIALSPATLPESGIALGIAAPGTPERDVEFDHPVELHRGEMWEILPVGSNGAGEYDVWARACVDRVCRSHRVRASSDAEGSDGLWAAGTVNRVRVSGLATFVDQPAVVSNQPGTGTVVDVTTATIGREPGSSTLEMTYNLDAPTTDLPNVTYLWPIAVDGVDWSQYLMASRTGPGSTEPTFVLIGVPPGGFANEVLATLSGELTADKVQWNVPMSLIKAYGGSSVVQGGGSPAEVRTGMAGVGYCCTVHDRLDTVTIGEYRVPQASARLGLAPAGTAVEDVPLTVDATVNASTGAFHGDLPTPAGSGTYLVVARSCYGAGACEVHTTSLTV